MEIKSKIKITDSLELLFPFLSSPHYSSPKSHYSFSINNHDLEKKQSFINSKVIITLNLSSLFN